MEKVKHTNPVKVIRDKCIECCAGDLNEVKRCGIEGCPLYPFRMGKNPYRKAREMTEEERSAMMNRLAKARDSKKS